MYREGSYLRVIFLPEASRSEKGVVGGVVARDLKEDWRRRREEGEGKARADEEDEEASVRIDRRGVEGILMRRTRGSSMKSEAEVGESVAGASESTRWV